MRLHRRQLHAHRESVRSGRIAHGECAADPIQPARPLRMVDGGLQPLRASRRTHSGHSFTQAGSNPTFAAGTVGIGTSRLRFENPAYSTFAASVGIAKDLWNVMLYG